MSQNKNNRRKAVDDRIQRGATFYRFVFDTSSLVRLTQAMEAGVIDEEAWLSACIKPTVSFHVPVEVQLEYEQRKTLPSWVKSEPRAILSASQQTPVLQERLSTDKKVVLFAHEKRAFLIAEDKKILRHAEEQGIPCGNLCLSAVLFCAKGLISTKQAHKLLDLLQTQFLVQTQQLADSRLYLSLIEKGEL